MNEKERVNYWKNICNELAESDLGKKEFCLQRSIHQGQLYHYLYKFRPDLIKSMSKKNKKTSAVKLTSFLPVKYKVEEKKQELKITLKTGHILSFEMLMEQIPEFINKMEHSLESSL